MAYQILDAANGDLPPFEVYPLPSGRWIVYCNLCSTGLTDGGNTRETRAIAEMLGTEHIASAHFIRPCNGCGKLWRNIFGDTGPCMECVKARQRTATRYHGQCKCGRKARLGEVHQLGRNGHMGRGCERCLGSAQVGE